MAVQPVTTAPVSVTTTSRGQEVTVLGRIDVHTVADVRLALHAVIADGIGDVHLHLGDAEIGDATGLGVIVESHHRARRYCRRLVLGETTPRTERLLRLARLNRVLFRGRSDTHDVGTVAPLTA